MTKIGRNDPCPCGSGLKYKKCCISKATPTPAGQVNEAGQLSLSLRAEVDKIQQAAAEKKNTLHTLGVFIFFTTDEGDGWLLEISEMDALQVAKAGEPITVEIDESEETIEINWSHKFAIRNKKFQTTDYKTKEVATHEDYPAARVSKAIRKAIQRFPKEMLEKVHITDDDNIG